MTVHIGPYEFDDIDYDAEGDVLYLSIGKPRPAADSEETARGARRPLRRPTTASSASRSSAPATCSPKTAPWRLPCRTGR